MWGVAFEIGDEDWEGGVRTIKASTFLPPFPPSTHLFHLFPSIQLPSSCYYHEGAGEAGWERDGRSKQTCHQVKLVIVIVIVIVIVFIVVLPISCLS